MDISRLSKLVGIFERKQNMISSIFSFGFSNKMIREKLMVPIIHKSNNSALPTSVIYTYPDISCYF